MIRLVKSRFVKWCLAAILAVALFIDSAAVNAAPSDNGGKRIGLSDAVQWGLKVSSELADAKAELAKKRTELQQAQQAVKSQEAKDRSLFAKPHSLSKDLEIQMKLPEAKKQLAEAEQTWNAKQRKVKYDVESLYMAAVQASLNEDGAKGKLTEAEKQEKDARQKMKLGAVSKEDADGASKRLEKAQSDLKVASLAAKSTRLALGAKIGQDFDKPVSFAFEPYYANLKQDRLNGYIAASEKTNLELFKAAESRKLAESKVATTRKLYVGKFGKGPTRAIESLYKAQDTDTEAFMAAYDQMLAAIKKKWEGFFWLLVIPIPKSLLQGEYDGLRYFDDQKYSLPVSMLDLNKAMLQEKDARKSAIDNVKQSYLAAKSAEEAYVQAMRARDKAKDDAAAAEKKFKLGLAVKDDLEQAKEAAALSLIHI